MAVGRHLLGIPVIHIVAQVKITHGLIEGEAVPLAADQCICPALEEAALDRISGDLKKGIVAIHKHDNRRQ